MALIFCPECGNQISDTAVSCPHCGFPLREYQQYMKDEELKKQQEAKRLQAEKEQQAEQERLKKKLCPECGETVGDVEICPYCGFNIKEKEDQDKEKIEELKQMQMRIKAREREASKAVSLPKCPTCGSTDIKRVSTVTKVVNAGAFGLLGNRRKKQFHCNNCGYEW